MPNVITSPTLDICCFSVDRSPDLGTTAKKIRMPSSLGGGWFMEKNDTRFSVREEGLKLRGFNSARHSQLWAEKMKRMCPEKHALF